MLYKDALPSERNESIGRLVDYIDRLPDEVEEGESRCR